MKNQLITSLTALGIVLSPALMKFAEVSPSEAPAVTVDDSAEVLCVSQADAPVHRRYRGRGDIEARLAEAHVVQVLSRRKNWRHVVYTQDDSAAKGWLLTKYLSFCEDGESTPEPEVASSIPPSTPSTLNVCSFNIQFLGNFKKRDNAAVAGVLEACDVAVIQELVAPPYPMNFPSGHPAKPDVEARLFFEEMSSLGFEFVLSEEDTGTSDKDHINSASTEWWAAFYKPAKLEPARDLHSGFLAEDRSNHDDYERVPYAFAFRTPNARLDFVLISVHLQPGSGKTDAARRKHELASIAAWVGGYGGTEQDFVIVGDMNLEDAGEIAEATPESFRSLNDDARATNTNVNSPKPYDHIMFQPVHTTEIDVQRGMEIVNLIEAMRPAWSGPGAYPGDPYDHDAFRQRYSDHHPVWMTMRIPGRDDD